MCLEATQQHTVPLDRNMSQSSQRGLPILFKALFLGFLLALPRAVDVLKPEGRQRSGWLKSQIALLSTVVLTSTETCQARSLALGQGQTLQER